MNKNRFYILIIVGLIISNLALIFFMKSPLRGRGEMHDGPKSLIIKKLDFNDAQKEEYLELVENHFSTVKELHNDVRENRQKLYKLLNHKNDDLKRDSLLNEISNKIVEIERFHYKHFEDIKNICTEQQLSKFENLTEELGKMFSRNRRNHRGKGRP